MNKHKAQALLSSCILALAVVLAQASFTPHRLYPLDTPLAKAALNAKSQQHESNLHESDNVPFILSINEGESVNVKLSSNSSITLNLNRGLDQDINVTVSIYSGPNLIDFQPAQLADDKSNNQSLSNSSTPTKSMVVTYKAHTFGDLVVHFHTDKQAGHAKIVCKIQNQPKDITIDDSSAFISVNIYRNWNLTVLIYVVGWIYFFAWSASFYFQIILNYRRKSVVGLNFDFIALNLLGFACYSIYNAALMFSNPVQSTYYQRYAYTRIPVEYNDLFFALHAFLMSLITMLQCIIYERGEQIVSLPAGIFVALSTVLGLGLYIASLVHSITFLDVVLYLSYVKLVITTIKYTPQAFMNYKRKATTGWSIHNILLDFTGGLFSLAQMFLIAYNYDDWISILGNFTKFGLAVISISFDILFMVQHYYLYKSVDGLEDSIERLNPVISESIRSASYAPQQQQPPTPRPRDDGRFAPLPDNGDHNVGFEE